MSQIQVAPTVRSVEVAGTVEKYVVMTLASQSNPNKSYRVDLTNGRCSCPSWIFSRKKNESTGSRALCKHLKSLGYKE